MAESASKRAERTVERLLYQSRWLLVPIYLGLSLLLIFLTVVFLSDLFALVPTLVRLSEKDAILATLSLIDLALVGSLVVMVIIAGYENFVSKIDLADADERLS